MKQPAALIRRRQTKRHPHHGPNRNGQGKAGNWTDYSRRETLGANRRLESGQPQPSGRNPL
jgi:hypothetical protein